MTLLRFFTISMLIGCTQNTDPSLRNKLDGMWQIEPTVIGDTAFWADWIDAGDTNDYYRVVIKLDSGMYDFNYKNNELAQVELFDNLFIEEFDFETDTSGILYSYELDTAMSYSRHPRIEANYEYFEIQKDPLQLLEIYNDTIFYRADIQFVTDSSFELSTNGSHKSLLVKFNEP